MPHISAYQCTSMPHIMCPSELPFSVTPSVPVQCHLSNAIQCHLSVRPISATYQVASPVPPYQCASVPAPISACQ
ncbi:unnamed protein product, partial [Staurois parvus]